MKKTFLYIPVFLPIIIAIVVSFEPATMTTEGKNLYDAKGEQVVLRGVNEMFIWSDDPAGETLMPEIAKTGANVVRIVWLSNRENEKATPANLDLVLQNAIDNGMFPMPELHGATGDLRKLQEQVDYWVDPEIVKVLKKHEAHLLLNIANECGGHEVTAEAFLAQYKKAIDRIRETGLKAPLVIDAPGWGQDLDILLETGSDLLKHDPESNLLLSVHMWWPSDDGSTQRIRDGLRKAAAKDLPLIVGEFAPMGVGCQGKIDYKTILEECEKLKIGWLAWSWGAVQNGDCALMDMTRGDKRGLFEGLTDWGLDVAVTNPYSIKNTSIRSDFLKNRIKQGNQ